MIPQETWFQQKAMSKKSVSLPGKDVVYRFLNKETFNWRKFLLLLSHHAISIGEQLTKDQRVKVLIVMIPYLNVLEVKKSSCFQKFLIIQP